MSEGITHCAIADDCRRLALVSNEICDPFKEVLEEYPEIVRLGSVTRAGGGFLAPLLQEYRENWKLQDGIEKRLAFLLGWHAHRAADMYFKLMYRQCDFNPDLTHHVRTYHDIVIFQQVYDDGETGPYCPQMLEQSLESTPIYESLDIEYAEHIFSNKWLQDLLELHPIKLEDNGDEWLDKITANRQYLRMDHQTVYDSPDEQKMEEFIEKPNFYDPNDKLIKLCRSIQEGSENNGIELNQALDEAMTGSQYAQSIHLGYNYLRAASEFFTGKFNEDMYKYQLQLATMPLFKGEFDIENLPGSGESEYDYTTVQPRIPNSSGRIVTTSIFEDCRQLACSSVEISSLIRNALVECSEAAHIGGIVDAPINPILDVLEDYAEYLDQRTITDYSGLANSEIDPEKFALVLGSICHNGLIQTLNESTSPNRWKSNETKSLRSHQDAIVLRNTAVLKDELHTDQEKVEMFEELFDALWQRTLLRMHTLNPDTDNIQQWMDSLFNWLSRDSELRQEYAEDMVNHNVEKTEFYDANDSIIVHLHGNESLGENYDINELVSKSQSSIYARAVQNSYSNLSAMNDYLSREISRGNLEERLALT